MNMEIMESVLNEMLEEMKQTNQQVARLNDQSSALTEKVNGFEKRLQEQKIIAAPVDTKPIEQRVKEGAEETRSLLSESMNKLNATLEAYPKTTVRQYRLLFFPETDPHGYAGRLLNRFLLSLLVLAILALLGGLGTQYIQTRYATATVIVDTVTPKPPPFPATSSKPRKPPTKNK